MKCNPPISSNCLIFKHKTYANEFGRFSGHWCSGLLLSWPENQPVVAKGYALSRPCLPFTGITTHYFKNICFVDGSDGRSPFSIDFLAREGPVVQEPAYVLPVFFWKEGYSGDRLFRSFYRKANQSFSSCPDIFVVQALGEDALQINF